MNPELTTSHMPGNRAIRGALRANHQRALRTPDTGRSPSQHEQGCSGLRRVPRHVDVGLAVHLGMTQRAARTVRQQRERLQHSYLSRLRALGHARSGVTLGSLNVVLLVAVDICLSSPGVQQPQDLAVMCTWAAVLEKPAASPAEAHESSWDGKRIAVVDANVFISLGTSVSNVADVIVTTEDVLNEVRDGVTRDVLPRIAITCREPSHAAMRAVAQFAHKTGDIHQLSLADIRLIALGYTLEAECGGVQHLRKEPLPTRSHARTSKAGQLPGWGENGSSPEWDAIDAVDDGESCSLEEPDVSDGCGITSPAAPARTPSHPTSGADVPDSDEARPEDPDESEPVWENARRSRNAFRRAKRKESRRAERAAGEQEPVCTAAAASDRDGPASQDTESVESSSEQQVRDSGGAQSVWEQKKEPDTSAAERQSNIVMLTADFPMQNVILQMGLQLESKDGRRIKALQRSVLRCEGCSTVCTSAKVFCPACGHPTLSKVQVTLDADGVEQYGVRKKHVLKGTRYPLPKPKSGRNAANPILSEDVYRAKVRRAKKKPSYVVDADDELLAGLTFGELNKHANQPEHVAQGLTYLNTGWKHNPNERKNMPRSNRRR